MVKSQRGLSVFFGTDQVKAVAGTFFQENLNKSYEGRLGPGFGVSREEEFVQNPKEHAFEGIREFAASLVQRMRLGE
jgi:hypothetical protein